MKGLPGKLALLLLSLLCVFGVLEIAIRHSAYQPLSYLQNGRENIVQPSADPERVYELVPGAQGVAWGADIRINADGFRGEPVAVAQPAYRVIAIGDSITFGNFLPVTDAYPFVLQSLLRQDGTDAEVLNLGVGGYDILQAVATLEVQGLRYRPDLVVLGYCLNDIAIASLNLAYIERLETYRTHWLFRSRLLQYLADRVDRLRLAQWQARRNAPEAFAERYRDRLLPLPQPDADLQALQAALPDRHPSGWYRSAARIDRLRYGLDRLARLGQAHGFPVVLVIFPWLETAADGHYPHAAAHRIVALEARRAGLAVIDLAGDFSAAGMQALRISAADAVHPNAEGHRLAAQRLHAYSRQHRPAAVAE